MKAKINWIKNMQMLAHTESGHNVTVDGPKELGGENLGIRPMEFLLIGVGSCTTIDIISILKKMRQNVDNCEVEVAGKRATKIPKIFTNIHLHFTITGNNLDKIKVQKAIDLSSTKYCSASIMLQQQAKITHSFTII